MTEVIKTPSPQGLKCTQTIVYPQPFLEITQNPEGNPQLHWSGNILNFSKMQIDKHHNIAYLALKQTKATLWFNQQSIELELSKEQLEKTDLMIQDHKNISITYPSDQGTKIQKIFTLQIPHTTPKIESKIETKNEEQIQEKPIQPQLPKEWTDLLNWSKKMNINPEQLITTFDKQKQELSALQNAFTLTKAKLTELESQPKKEPIPQSSPSEDTEKLIAQVTELQSKIKELQTTQEPLTSENKRLINQVEGMKVVIARLEQQVNEAAEHAGQPDEATQQHINEIQDQLLKKVQEINQYRALLSMIKSNAKKATF